MSILVIDIGNTRIKWGLAQDAGWLRQGWVATAQARDLHAEFESLPPVRQIVISNVAGPAVQAQVVALLPPSAELPCWVVSAAVQCGVRSSYAEPGALGPDRWAALIGAWHQASAACVVVNAGTTMTVDALSAEGVFLGGCIVPGLRLMRVALARDTANLAEREGHFQYFPDNTGDAIMSGAINALAGAVEKVAAYLQKSDGAEPLILLSGGDAAQIERVLSGRIMVVDNLVLEGLLEIARQTFGKA